MVVFLVKQKEHSAAAGKRCYNLHIPMTALSTAKSCLPHVPLIKDDMRLPHVQICTCTA